MTARNISHPAQLIDPEDGSQIYDERASVLKAGVWLPDLLPKMGVVDPVKSLCRRQWPEQVDTAAALDNA